MGSDIACELVDIIDHPRLEPVSADPAPKLGLLNVRVRLSGREVLSVDDLRISAGEVLAVLGPNGAGKSTLLQLCGFLRAPDEGRMFFDGGEMHGVPLWARRRATLLLQAPIMLERSVLANVELGLALRGRPRAERRQRSVAWLERFGVAHLAGRAARTLSGGEAQRVALARALAFEPEIVLLDEPFTALDQPTRETLVRDAVRELRRLGATTVFVTHDRWEAQTLADRLIVLIDGRVRQAGTPAEVCTHPADAIVAAFVSSASNGERPAHSEVQ
ncbi:MAG: ABC transporter ATP-binding protein [Dehalococcoidia bacterium]